MFTSAVWACVCVRQDNSPAYHVFVIVFISCVGPGKGFFSGVRQMAFVDHSLLNWLAALLTFLHATLTRDHSQYLRKQCLSSQLCDLLHFAGIDSAQKSALDRARDSVRAFCAHYLWIVSLHLMWITSPHYQFQQKARRAPVTQTAAQSCTASPWVLLCTLAVCLGTGLASW